MDYKIKLDGYEGPLDLLIDLIEKEEVDIYDIPINKITKQYLAYIYDMEELNLEIASEFLIMAATLLQIKSKMLLPKEKKIVEGEEVEIDPREELVKRILAYKQFKLAAEELKELGNLELKAYYKPMEDL
ncbi:MAG TPA: segregation/condensation protein A, partial [Tissierellaceae bacterium]|nr:segregation/condensation protein A [Tissierellaceae bacterium]